MVDAQVHRSHAGFGLVIADVPITHGQEIMPMLVADTLLLLRRYCTNLCVHGASELREPRNVTANWPAAQCP